MPGLTLANVAFRPYSPAELAALDDLQPSVLVFLLYGGAIDQTHAGQLAPFLVAHQPRIIYRPFAGNVPQWEAADWARECDKRIRAVGLGECICANEMNLVAEEHGFGEDWPRHVRWLTDFAAAWRKLNDRPLHLPALSPSGAWYKGLLAYKAANLDLLFDRIDAHAYGPDAATIAMAVASTLRGPCDVTEFNQVDPALLFSQLEKGIESVTWFLVGGTINQSQYDLLKQPTYYQSFKAWRPTPMAAPKDFTSPNHGGLRPETTGCVVHATLGGTSSPQAEFDATVNWFNNPVSQVSAHAVVGPVHQVWRPVRPGVEAWHCRASNARKRGLEMCKAHLGDQILPEILDDSAKVIADWWLADRAAGVHWLLEWDIENGLAEHHEMPTNTDGHQDVGGPFDRSDFLARVKKHAGQGDELSDAQKKAVLDDLDFLWSYSTADQIKKNPAESEKVLHERIVGLKVTLGLQQG